MEQAASSKDISTEPDEPPVAAEGDSQPDEVGRPDWLPEKFWSSGNGPQYEELAKSYNELEQWRMKSRDEALAHFKDEIIEETKNGIPEGVPDSVDGYEFKFDQGILPQGLDFDPSTDDPMLEWWRKHCYDNRLPQESFESGINAFLKADIETIPDFDAEISKLGDNGSERFGNVLKWLQRNTSEKTVSTINKQKMSADLIEALEEIQSKSTTRVPQQMTGAPEPAGLSEDDLKNMQNEPGYYNGTDSALIKKVTEGYAALATRNARRN